MNFRQDPETQFEDIYSTGWYEDWIYVSGSIREGFEGLKESDGITDWKWEEAFSDDDEYEEFDDWDDDDEDDWDDDDDDEEEEDEDDEEDDWDD